MARIVPSVLSADFADLAKDVRTVQKAGAHSVQVDVMDGHFVPNITVGPIVIGCLRKQTSLFLDVHLMIENPEFYLEAFAKAGSDLLTVHFEACKNPGQTLKKIRKLGVKVGMAIRPKTSEKVLWPYLSQLDLALVMTVEPGFGGQAFIHEMLPKVERLRQKIDEKKFSCELQVDGGINSSTAPLAARSGATSLVAGSAVYDGKNPIKAFKALQRLVDFPSARR